MKAQLGRKIKNTHQQKLFTPRTNAIEIRDNGWRDNKPTNFPRITNLLPKTNPHYYFYGQRKFVLFLFFIAFGWLLIKTKLKLRVTPQNYPIDGRQGFSSRNQLKSVKQQQHKLIRWLGDANIIDGVVTYFNLTHTCCIYFVCLVLVMCPLIYYQCIRFLGMILIQHLLLTRFLHMHIFYTYIYIVDLLLPILVRLIARIVYCLLIRMCKSEISLVAGLRSDNWF